MKPIHIPQPITSGGDGRHINRLMAWVWGMKDIIPSENGKILVEHCPYCKQVRGAINKECKDQRFHDL